MPPGYPSTWTDADCLEHIRHCEFFGRLEFRRHSGTRGTEREITTGQAKQVLRRGYIVERQRPNPDYTGVKFNLTATIAGEQVSIIVALPDSTHSADAHIEVITDW